MIGPAQHKQGVDPDSIINQPSAMLLLVYILLPGFVLIAIVALLYVCCAKRYRFNWFERSLMEQTSCTNTISVTAQDADEKACIIPAGSSDSGVINHGSTQDTKLPMEATKFPISMETTMLPAQSGTTYSTPYKPLSYQPPDISLTSGCSSDSILSSGAFTGGSVCDNTELFWVPAAVAGAGKKRASTGLIQIGVTTCDSPPGSPTKAPSTSASLQDMAYSSGGGGGGSDSERKLSAGTDSVASSGMPSGGGNGRGRRRASMQDALDHTKINASLYDQDSLRQQPSFDGIQEESHGSLNLALRYNWEQALLTVRINQARDLVPRSAISNGTNASTKDATTRRTSCTGSGDHSTGSVHNSANPYCRVSVLPSTTVSHVNTKVHKHTLSPEFEEEFLFEVAPADLNTSIVQVRIMDHDSGSTKHVCLGITTVQLCDVDLVDTDTGGCGGTAAVMWKNIFPYRKDREQINYGEVMFSMGYLPSAERLTVVIQKARNLRPPEDGKTTANPYIKASLLCAGGLKRLKKKKTSTKRSCLNPVWNEALVFSVGREQLRAGGVYLEIAVHTDNILIPGINNDCIGKVALGTGGTLGGGVGGFCGSDEMTHWTDMLNASSVTARWHRLRPPENA